MIFYLMLIVYLLLLIRYRTKKVVVALLLLQVVSLISIILINGESFSYTPLSWINALFTLFANLMIILPWKSYSGLKSIIIPNPKRVDLLVKVLLIISFFCFIIFCVTAFLVQTLVKDINAFKYDGESVYFYYNMLPFDVRFLIIAFTLHSISYFMIFFHFYYMYVGDKKRMILCFIASLNLILHGLCFFSRWTLTMYVSLYCVLTLLFYPLLDKNLKKSIKRIAVVAVVGTCFVLIETTINRFGEDTDSYRVKSYENRIPRESLIQNLPLYSMFDYLGQNNSAGIEVLNRYDGTTFKGGFAIKQVKGFLQSCRILSGDNSEKEENVFREKYFKQHSGGFIGWAAYMVYDFGYIITIVICFLYYRIVINTQPTVHLRKMIVASLFIQIPICAIYYSWLPMVLMCMFLYFFMNLYLSYKR